MAEKRLTKSEWYQEGCKKLDKLGEELLKWINTEPSKENDFEINWYLPDFFQKKYIHPDWLEQFRKVSATFNDCFNLAEEIQKTKILKMLSDKKFATGGMSLIAKNILGWKDTSEINQNTKIEINKDTLDKMREKYFKQPKFSKKKLANTNIDEDWKDKLMNGKTIKSSEGQE